MSSSTVPKRPGRSFRASWREGRTLLYSARHDIVGYPARTPGLAQVAGVDFQQVDGHMVAPASLKNLQRLAAAKLPVPSPLRGYDWPGPFTPWHAQRVTAAFMVTHPHCLVLNAMGTGKTEAALWASDFLMQADPRMKTLVVTTLSTVDGVWSEAVFKTFLAERSAVVLTGSAERRRRLLAEPHDYYIVNHDGVGVLKKELLERDDIQIVVVDEASCYRNSRSGRSKMARRVLGPRRYLWAMTGTPTPAAPTDAYGLAALIGVVHESYRAFHDRTMVKVSAFKWTPRRGAYEEAFKLMQPAIRFSISDVTELPPCTMQSRSAELTPQQRSLMRDFAARAQAEIGGKRIDVINEAALRTKLLQLASGAVYDAAHEAQAVDARPRMAVLEEAIEQSGDKALVFAPFTSALHMIARRLEEIGLRVGVVSGSVRPKERSDIFHRFQQTDELDIIVADPGTMAHGLTLTAAATIVWYAPTDRSEVFQQANKRIDRPGQVKNTTVVQIAALPLEKEIYRRLATNETLQGIVFTNLEGLKHL